MAKILSYVLGASSGKDTLKAAPLIASHLSEHEGMEIRVDPRTVDPLESFKAQSGSSLNQKIEIHALSVESSNVNGGKALNVRVYDYLKGGDCVVNMNYPTTHEAFLKGCRNLARTLAQHLRDSEQEHRSVIER